MADKHAIVERQLTDAEYVGTKRIAILIDEKMDNGSIVALKGLKKGEREIYEVKTPAKDTPLKDLYIVTTPEVMKDERLQHSLDQFVNLEGTIGNAERLIEGNIFGLTKEAFDGDPKEEYVVELAEGSRKLKAVQNATASTTTVGKIVDYARGYYGVKIG